jgi:hypothetical protein
VDARLETTHNVATVRAAAALDGHPDDR